MKRTLLAIETLHPFHFTATVESHGWHQLPPFQWDSEAKVLCRPELLPSGAVEMRLRPADGRDETSSVLVEILHPGRLPQEDVAEARRRAVRILQIDRDIRPFHQICRQWPELGIVIERTRGRILCGGTLYEDLVKTLLTTNINWEGTRRMVANLVERFGIPLPWDSTRRTFPAPADVHAGLRDGLGPQLGLGYRLPYLREATERMLAGKIDHESLEERALSSEQAYGHLRSIPGLGDYAATSLMILLGYTDRIPMDSWARRAISARFFAGEKVPDSDLLAVFEPFDAWKGLVFWFYPWG